MAVKRLCHSFEHRVDRRRAAALDRVEGEAGDVARAFPAHHHVAMTGCNSDFALADFGPVLGDMGLAAARDFDLAREDVDE